MSSTVILSQETVQSFALSDVRLLGIYWDADGPDLALRLLMGDGHLAILKCSWSSEARIDLSFTPGRGGSPLSWECRCEQLGTRWRIALDFASHGLIELDCNETRLEYHAG